MPIKDSDLGEGVKIYAQDEDGKAFFGSSVGTPPTTANEFVAGAIFVDIQNKVAYINTGSAASPSWNSIHEIATGDIADDAVSVEHLDDGILPSHVVKFAGEFTTAGGDTAEQASVSGVVATDIVIASILDNGTNDVTLLQSAAGTDVIDFTMSADPSSDCVISYVVLRAAA